MTPVILCVDDEKLVLESLTSQLRSHYGDDYEYETAQNPKEAHELIDELMEEGITIYVIISDWLMPITKGDQFLIDVCDKLPDTKLIMLSGHADEDSVDRARKYANLHQFIRKPWEKDHLMQSIDAAVEEVKLKRMS
ncbi:MAG: response regulator [Bacteroidota bacterium]